MDEHVPEQLRQLQVYHGQLLRQREQAEALIVPLNAQLQRLAVADLLPDLTYLGDILWVEPYEEESDSGRVYVAVLSATLGFGAICSDTEQVRYLYEPDEVSRVGIKARLTPFAELPGRVQACLAPHVTALMDRLLHDVGIRHRKCGPSGPMPSSSSLDSGAEISRAGP
jgi:hypothetical protein